MLSFSQHNVRHVRTHKCLPKKKMKRHTERNCALAWLSWWQTLCGSDRRNGRWEWRKTIESHFIKLVRCSAGDGMWKQTDYIYSVCWSNNKLSRRGQKYNFCFFSVVVLCDKTFLWFGWKNKQGWLVAHKNDIYTSRGLWCNLIQWELIVISLGLGWVKNIVLRLVLFIYSTLF